jgi:hypothetical protein
MASGFSSTVASRGVGWDGMGIMARSIVEKAWGFGFQVTEPQL